MATTPTPTAPPGPATAPAGPRPPRPLWQAPLFVLGVAALAGMAYFRPLAVDPGRRQVDRELADAHHALIHDNDPDAAAKHARAALDHIDNTPARAGEAHLMLGTALLAAGDRESGAAARVRHLDARRELREAESLGVPDADRGRLAYRLAKAAARCGDDPRRVAEALAAAADGADDRAEAYELLAQAWLRVSPPEVRKALDANNVLRNNVANVKDDVLARAQLLGGELLFRLDRDDEARKTLALIGGQAPPPVRAKARLLRARSHQKKGEWSDAAPLWQAALADAQAPTADADKAAVLYDLGVCYRQLDQAADAARVWQECAKLRPDADGHPAAAAAALANLRLAGGNPAAAAELLLALTEKTRRPADWKNDLADLGELRGAFEKTLRALSAAGKYEEGLNLATRYERLAEPGKVDALRAEAAAGYARALAAKDPPDTAGAREQYRLAGAALVRSAEAAADAAAKGEALWQAAARYRDGGDAAHVVTVLDKLLAEEKRPERLSEGWYLLGEAHRTAGDRTAAEKAFQSCIGVQPSAAPNPFPYRARYQLALFVIEEGKKLDDAVSILEQNLRQLQLDPDPEALEKTSFLLGDLYWQARRYRDAVPRLEMALGQVSRREEGAKAAAPPQPEATRALLHLADAYRQIAAEELKDLLIGTALSPEARDHKQKEHRRWLGKAVAEYEELAALLEKPAAKGHLADEERVQVPFDAANCRLDAGEYEAALKAFEALAAKYPATRLEGVYARAGMLRAYYSLGQDEKARACLAEVKAGLAGQDKSVQETFEGWLNDVSKPYTVATPERGQ